jgi:CDP-diacylglycerol--serine O-phosphatidyltransferase
MDSLADVISFGMAPAVLAYAWGIDSPARRPLPSPRASASRRVFLRVSVLLCGAMRLARFNVQSIRCRKTRAR